MFYTSSILFFFLAFNIFKLREILSILYGDSNLDNENKGDFIILLLAFPNM